MSQLLNWLLVKCSSLFTPAGNFLLRDGKSPNFMQASRTTMNEMLYFITKNAPKGGFRFPPFGILLKTTP
jgi:hypothetical protein